MFPRIGNVGGPGGKSLGLRPMNRIRVARVKKAIIKSPPIGDEVHCAMADCVQVSRAPISLPLEQNDYRLNMLDARFYVYLLYLDSPGVPKLNIAWQLTW